MFRRGMGTLGCAAALVLGAADSASGTEKPWEIRDRFHKRVTTTTYHAIAGEALNGLPQGAQRRVRARVLMNRTGGGEEQITTLPSEEARCNLAETLAWAIRHGDPACVHIEGRTPIRLFDRSVFPPRAVPPIIRETVQPRYGRLGPDVDELRTRRDVRTVVNRIALARQRRNPYLDRTSARFDVVQELMENVIASRKARRHLVRYLIATSGESPRRGVADPVGRPATVLEVPDFSRAGIVKVTFNGEERYYDLTDAAETTMQLFYDPETFEILARRDVLESTTRPELQPYLDARAPGTAYLSTRINGAIKMVRDSRLVAYRVPCSEIEFAGPRDNFCVEWGRPGGSGVATHIRKPGPVGPRSRVSLR